MRILYIHQHFLTHQEAGGTRSYSMAKHLLQKGHEVIMLTANRSHNDWSFVEKKDIDGIHVIYVKNPYSSYMSFPMRIISFMRFMILSTIISLRIRDIDLVFATSTPLTVGIPGMAISKLRKIPFIFEVRDLWPELAISMGIIKNRMVVAILKWFERKIYTNSDEIIALAPGIRQKIALEYYPINKIALIPNGSDINIFHTKITKTREKLPIGKNDFVLMYTGTHGIANGLQWVIDIAIEAQERHINELKFVLIGDGSTKPGLVAQQNKYKLTNVIFIDPVPKKELAEYIQEADMGMQILANIESFYYGTSPNKFFDYLAAGKPVLNNYPGWVSDLITEYKCGISVSPINRDDFFQKIDTVLSNRGILLEMEQNAFRLAKERFDRDMLADQFETTLTKSAKLFYRDERRMRC